LFFEWVVTKVVAELVVGGGDFAGAGSYSGLLLDGASQATDCGSDMVVSSGAAFFGCFIGCGVVASLVEYWSPRGRLFFF
jgi:hypothetical protein